MIRADDLPEAADQRARRTAAVEILLLGLILAVAVALPPLLEPIAGSLSSYTRLLGPSLWLLLAGGLWLWRRPIFVSLVRGGRRRAIYVAALCTVVIVLILALALLWPRDGTTRLTGGDLIKCAAFVTLIPAAEELFFRGLLLDHLQRRLGAPVAVLLTSAVFALMHLPQGTFVVMALLSGLLCGVTVLTRSLLWAVVLHSGWNALVLVPTITERAAERLLFAAVAAGLLGAATAWGVLSRRRPERTGGRGS